MDQQALRVLRQLVHVHDVRQHAQAITASVTLECTKRKAQLTIEDDGIGFDVRRIPAELVRRYEQEGYWTRETLGDLLARGLAECYWGLGDDDTWTEDGQDTGASLPFLFSPDFHMDEVETLSHALEELVPRWLAACDVLCQPSLVEPWGQSLLEALACCRSVVATRVGGPPEFVPPEAGVLVDPLDEDALVEALRTAAAFPTPNPAGRAAAEAHDLSAQARRVEAVLLRAARDRRA
mgnify:CR=1 FL=1